MKNIRADIAKVIADTAKFYQSPETGMALINVKGIKEIAPSATPLTDYNFPKDTYKYLDDCAEKKLRYWEKRLCVNDFGVPSLGPWYGIAEHSAFLGGEVEYSEDTSWHHIVMNDYSDRNKIAMDENNDIYKMVVGGITYARERYGDLLAPMVRGTSGVLEIANTLRGNDFFYDFYEEEDSLRELLKFCEEAIIWYYNKQLDAAGDVMGGVVTGFGEWLPGRAIGHISEDTTTMISVDSFEDFAREHTKNICAAFDGTFIHTHALSERCLESIGNIPNIKLMEISSDPNTDRAIEVFKRNKDKIKPIPLLNLTKKEIVDNLPLFKEQKTVIWFEAATIDEAKEMCELVRSELPIR